MSARSASTVLLLACLVATSGCGGGPGTTSRPHVRIAVLPFLSYAPLFIAEEEGLFRAHGVDVELITVQTAEAYTAFAKGDVDCVSSFLSSGLLNMIARGAGIRIVADKGHAGVGGCAANGLLVRRDLIETGAVKSPADLKGLTLDGYPGTVEEFWIDRWLAPYGLSMADMVQSRVPLGAKMDVLRTGRLDVIAWSEPFLSQAVEEKLGVVYATPDLAYPNLQWAVLMYGPRLETEDRDLGQRVMDAYLEGVARYNQGKTARNVAIMARATGLTDEVIRRSCWLPIRGDGRIDLESLTAFEHWAVAKGLTDKVLPIDQVWDPGFVDRAGAAGAR